VQDRDIITIIKPTSEKLLCHSICPLHNTSDKLAIDPVAFSYSIFPLIEAPGFY